MNKFTVLFLISSWVLYFGRKGDFASGVILTLSGLYAITTLIAKWREDNA